MAQIDDLRAYAAANPDDDLLVFGNWRKPGPLDLKQFQVKGSDLATPLPEDPDPDDDPDPDPVLITLFVDAMDGANLRDQSSTKGKVLKAIPWRTPIKVEARLIPNAQEKRDWRKLGKGQFGITGDAFVANELLSTTQPPISSPTPEWFQIKPSMRGLHGDAGGWRPTNAEIDIVRRNNIEWMFLIAYQSGQADASISSFRSAGVKQFIIRADTNDQFAGVPDAANFIARTVENLKEYARALGTAKDMLIVPHNEPNLYQEGYGHRWTHGGAFAQWFKQVAAAYQSALPGCRIGFPACSPGGSVPGVRFDEATFLKDAQPAIDICDFVTVHYYWVDPDGADINPPIDKWLQWFPGKPIVGTEVGPGNEVQSKPTAFRRSYQYFGDRDISLAAWLLNNRGVQMWRDWLSSNMTL